MPAKFHHYSDEEIQKYASFWTSLYKSKMPYFNNEEVLKLVFKYRCPPWRFPATMWYFGKTATMRIEQDRKEREDLEKWEAQGRKGDPPERPTMKEAQRIAETKMFDQFARSKSIPKIADGPDDPLVWSYKVLKTERKKGVVRL